MRSNLFRQKNGHAFLTGGGTRPLGAHLGCAWGAGDGRSPPTGPPTSPQASPNRPPSEPQGAVGARPTAARPPEPARAEIRGPFLRTSCGESACARGAPHGDMRIKPQDSSQMKPHAHAEPPKGCNLRRHKSTFASARRGRPGTWRPGAIRDMLGGRLGGPVGGIGGKWEGG